MNKFVLDASALLAYIKDENGTEHLNEILPYSIISTVNYTEVASVLQTLNMSILLIEDILQDLISEVCPFTQSQALIAADLRNVTKDFGLSLGDRACLALGIEKQIPIYTADKIWSKINLKNLDLRLIR